MGCIGDFFPQYYSILLGSNKDTVASGHDDWKLNNNIWYFDQFQF